MWYKIEQIKEKNFFLIILKAVFTSVNENQFAVIYREYIKNMEPTEFLKTIKLSGSFSSSVSQSMFLPHVAIMHTL